MTSFILKIIAMITMIIDHSGDVFNPVLGFKSVYFNAIGRIAFPLFAFMIVEGYRHTHNIKKYILRLFIAALISEIPFYILVVNYMHAKDFAMDVLFTFVFGLFALLIWDFKASKQSEESTKEEKSKSFSIEDVFIWIVKIILIALLIVIATLLGFDYGETGILLILAIYLLFKKHKVLFFFSYLAISIFNYRHIFVETPLWGTIFVITATVIPFVFMLLYNGQKGKNTKYGMYVIYPLHLIILELIRHFCM